MNSDSTILPDTVDPKPPHKKRKSIPIAIETAVLIRSRRRCCLCVFWEDDRLQKDGQIAHVDHDPSNCAEDNLAYLCLKHHNEYDSKQIQGKNISQQEIRHAQNELFRWAGEPSQNRFEVTLTLERDFDSYSEEDQSALVVLIEDVLRKRGDVKVQRRERGSVRVTFSLSGEDACRVVEAFEDGILAEQDVVAIAVAPDEREYFAPVKAARKTNKSAFGALATRAVHFHSDSKTCVLDVDDIPSAVSLDRETGQFALREELANGGSIPSTLRSDKVVGIESVTGDGGHLEVKLVFESDDGTRITLSLGTADQPEVARAWIDEVKTAVAKKERSPRLNPTVDLDQAVAIPSIMEAPHSAGPGEAAPVAVAPPSPPAKPVEIPHEKLAIDADLELELDAAMAGQMTEPTTPPIGAQDPTPHQSAVSAELPESEEQLEPGTKLKAKVQSVTADDVFCEVGFRSPGVLPARQFPQGKQPRIDEEFLVVVEKFDPENSVILVNLPKATRRAKGNWEELTVGQVVDCMVTKVNKGGLEVNIGPLRAFLPASQVDLGFAPALDSFVGKKLTVQITEMNPAKRNLVVSRRTILIEERKELAVGFWRQVEVGQQYTGTVKTIRDYGAFVDLGGADGFLYIGEMSWTRVKHPSEVLQEGSQAEVVVLSLDREKQKIGLGMRQLATNPWAGVEDRYPTGKNVSGKVTRVSDFGAFVELETGVEGLIHISELDHQRVRRATDVVNVGQEVNLQVLEVLPDRQRISLSLKALKQKPEKPKDEDMAPSQGLQYERKRKTPLRGGTSSESGGGGVFGTGAH